MAKKNPAVLWNVDQTGDVIGAAGRQRAQKNIGINDGEGKLIGQSATNSFMTSITLDDSNELKAVFGRPTLLNLTPDTDHKNFSIGTNSETGAIETQDLKNPSSSTDGNGTTYVSSVQQASNGKVSYKTQTITEATDESHLAKKGITTLTSDLYASNTRTTGHTTAVTPDGVWDAIDSLDVNDITGFGKNQTLKALSETNGKIAAEFQSIEIDGSAVTLGAASQAVVTDASKNLTTEDLSVSSATDGSATNKFVSSVTANAKGKITVTTANVAIGGGAVTLDNASQAVVTDASKNLTTEDLSVSSATDGSDTNKFVYSVTANAKGKITVTKGTLSVATDNAIGGIKTGFTDDNANRKYAVDVVDSGTGKDTAFVQVPLASVYNTTTPANTYAGLVKSVSPQSTDPLSIRYHGVEIKNDGTMRVFVPYWHTNIASDSLEIPDIGRNVNTYEETVYVELFLKANGGLQWGYGPHEDYGDCRELSVNNIVALTHQQDGDHEDTIYKLVIDTDWNILYNNSNEIGLIAPIAQLADEGKMVVVSGGVLAYTPVPDPGATIHTASSTSHGPAYSNMSDLTIWSSTNRVVLTPEGGTAYDQGYLVPYITQPSSMQVLIYPKTGECPEWQSISSAFPAGTDLRWTTVDSKLTLAANTNGNDHKSSVSYPFVTGSNTEVTSSYGFAGGIGSVAGGINVRTEYIEETGEYITHFDPVLNSSAGNSSRFAMGKNCLVSMSDSFALGYDNKVLDTGRSGYYPVAASGALGYSNYIENAYHAITIGGNNHVLPDHHGTILIGENLESDGSARIIMGSGNESTQHVAAIRVTGKQEYSSGVNLEELSYSGTLWLKEGLLTTMSLRNNDGYTREVWLRTYNRVPFLTRPYYLAEYWNPEVSEFDNQSDVLWGRSSVKYPSDTSSYFYIKDKWTDSGLKRDMEVSCSLYSSELVMNRTILATTSSQGDIMRGLQIRVDASGIFLSNNLLSDTNLSNTTPYTNSSYIAIGHIPGNGGMISQNTQWTNVALHSYLGVYTNEYDGASHAANTAGIPAPVSCSSLILKVIPVSSLTTTYSSSPVIVPSYIEGECVLIYGDVVGGQYVVARTGASYTGFTLPYDKCVLACTVKAKTSTSEGRVAVTWWAVQ